MVAAPASTRAPPTERARPPWNGEGEFSFALSDFHFELGGTQVYAVDATGKVEDLFVRHVSKSVREVCASTKAEQAEICADLRKHGDKEVIFTEWSVASYHLSPHEHAQLRRVLSDAKMASLDRDYQQDGLQDGSTTNFLLTTSDGTTGVSCYGIGTSSVPDALRPVHRFVTQAIYIHEEARKNATAVDEQESERIRAAARRR